MLSAILPQTPLIGGYKPSSKINGEDHIEQERIKRQSAPPSLGVSSITAEDESNAVVLTAPVSRSDASGFGIIPNDAFVEMQSSNGNHTSISYSRVNAYAPIKSQISDATS